MSDPLVVRAYARCEPIVCERCRVAMDEIEEAEGCEDMHCPLQERANHEND